MASGGGLGHDADGLEVGNDEIGHCDDARDGYEGGEESVFEAPVDEVGGGDELMLAAEAEEAGGIEEVDRDDSHHESDADEESESVAVGFGREADHGIAAVLGSVEGGQEDPQAHGAGAEVEVTEGVAGGSCPASQPSDGQEEEGICCEEEPDPVIGLIDAWHGLVVVGFGGCRAGRVFGVICIGPPLMGEDGGDDGEERAGGEGVIDPEREGACGLGEELIGFPWHREGDEGKDEGDAAQEAWQWVVTTSHEDWRRLLLGRGCWAFPAGSVDSIGFEFGGTREAGAG
jgi:hypothetical protein